MSPRSLIHDHPRESQRLSNLNRVWQAQWDCLLGSACGPVIVPVFKTGDRYPCDGDGGFDSHSLPPLISVSCVTKSATATIAADLGSGCDGNVINLGFK